MRIKPFAIALLLVFCALLASCDDPNPGDNPGGTTVDQGSLRVVYAILPSSFTFSQIKTYTITATNGAGTTMKVSGTSLPLEIVDMPVGTWDYKIEFFDSNGDILAERTVTGLQIQSKTRLSDYVTMSADDYKDMTFGISAKTGYVRVRPFAKTSAQLANLVIPQTVDGITVKGIAINGFKDCTTIKTVSFPTTLTIIGDGAFSGCKALTAITIPDTVVSMGSSAFQNCTALKTATLGTNIGMIGSLTFAACTALETVNWNTAVVTIGPQAFQNCTKLTSLANGVLSLPATVATIGDSAFKGCTSIKTVALPASVTSIGRYCFSGCTSASTITLTDNVRAIGAYAFENTAITTMALPENIKFTKIPSGLFYQCKKLTSVTIPSQITAIEGSAFNMCTELVSFTVPDQVTSIGAYCFSSCNKLQSITLGSGITSIPQGTFGYCYALKSIDIPANVKTIDYFAFRYCSDITFNIASAQDDVQVDNLWLALVTNPTVNWEATV